MWFDREAPKHSGYQPLHITNNEKQKEQCCFVQFFSSLLELVSCTKFTDGVVKLHYTVRR